MLHRLGLNEPASISRIGAGHERRRERPLTAQLLVAVLLTACAAPDSFLDSSTGPDSTDIVTQSDAPPSPDALIDATVDAHDTGDGMTAADSPAMPDAGPMGGQNAATIAAGNGHSCARRPDGTARCWGRNTEGELGDGTMMGSTTASLDVFGVADILELTAGDELTCARTRGGIVRCWGLNNAGQLGMYPPPSSNPVAVVTPGLTTALGVAAGGYHACARLIDGTVQCWGNNGYSELGIGTTGGRPPRAPVMIGTTVAQIAAGGFHSCAREVAGTLQCWGGNEFGELGSPTSTLTSNVPLAVAGVTGAVEVALGVHHTCVRLMNGSVQCWGRNDSGQLGDRTLVLRRAPVAVTGLTGVVQIAAGEQHTCARIADGTVQCWGQNAIGQLGNGSTGMSTVPVRVSMLAPAIEIAAGYTHNCARLRDTNVYCWGDNSHGQLGDRSTTDRTTPVRALGL